MSPARNRSNVHGPQAVAAAEALRRMQSKDAKWPYDWDFAPPGAKHDLATGYAAVPAAGATLVEVVRYAVADGLNFYPTGLVLTLMGSNYLPGDFTWSLLLNAPVAVTAAQAMPVDGYQNVPFCLGTLEIPWKITPAERNLLHSRDVISLQVLLPLGSSLIGSTAVFAGVIKGYLLPFSD